LISIADRQIGNVLFAMDIRTWTQCDTTKNSKKNKH